MKQYFLDRLIVVGDRVLIKPSTMPEKTKSGLLLPAGYAEKEVVQSGYVVKCGPGIPFAPASTDDEPWKQNTESPQYIATQAREGDLALFLQKDAIEIKYHDEKFYIVPNQAILLLERDID